jgi:hypothetical protein
VLHAGLLPDHDQGDDDDLDLDDDLGAGDDDVPRLHAHPILDDLAHDDGGVTINHYCVHVDHEHGRLDIYDHAGHGPHHLLAGDDRAAALDDLLDAVARDRVTGVVRPPLH